MISVPLEEAAGGGSATGFAVIDPLFDQLQLGRRRLRPQVVEQPVVEHRAEHRDAEGTADRAEEGGGRRRGAELRVRAPCSGPRRRAPASRGRGRGRPRTCRAR